MEFLLKKVSTFFRWKIKMICFSEKNMLGQLHIMLLTSISSKYSAFVRIWIYLLYWKFIRICFENLLLVDIREYCPCTQ